MRKIRVAVATVLFTVVSLMGMEKASAADQLIGWVLDANGSVACYVMNGTNNHVMCWAYPPGNPNQWRVVVDDWLPYSCLGGAYMIPGNNNGTPAYLVYRNVSGYYCGRVPGLPNTFKAGTCWNQAAWNEGYFSNYAGTQQIGSYFPYTIDGFFWYPCVGSNNQSNAGHVIWYY